MAKKIQKYASVKYISPMIFFQRGLPNKYKAMAGIKNNPQQDRIKIQTLYAKYPNMENRELT